jgi:hypothetical protein
MDHYRNMINGAISGFFTVFITQPFQVTRTSMMVTYFDGKPYGFRQIIKELYKQEGLKGFYRGFFPTLLKTPIGTAIYFSSLEHNKHFLNRFEFNKTTLNFLSSAFARFNQCVLTNPLLVVVTRFEVIGFHSYNNLFDAVMKIKKEEGLKGFTAGLKPLLIKEVPTAALFYTFYEAFKKMFNNFGFANIQFQASVSAVLANIILTFLNNPIDVIRTRLQYVHISGNKNHNYKGVLKGIYLIAKTEGIKGLTVGMIPRILKRAVASALAWTIYETLKISGLKKYKSENLKH